MSSPSRTITATDASSRSGSGRRDRHGPDAVDLTSLSGGGVASSQRRAVDRDAHLHRLARAFTCQRYKRVGRVGGAGFAPSGATRLAEDSVDVRLPRRAEPRPGVRRQSGLDAVRAVGISPLMRFALDVQPPRPGSVVGLGSGAHLPAPIAQSLHARLGRRLQQLPLGARICACRARDLRCLRSGKLAGAERGVGLGQLLERPRRLQRPGRRTNRLAALLGHPVRRAAMPAVAPDLCLLDPTRQASLDRRAQPLSAGGVVEELHGTRRIERAGDQLLRDLLELAEHLCEHASPSGPDTDRGSAITIRTYVRFVKLSSRS
jgi:hypothetical protein